MIVLTAVFCFKVYHMKQDENRVTTYIRLLWHVGGVLEVGGRYANAQRARSQSNNQVTNRGASIDPSQPASRQSLTRLGLPASLDTCNYCKFARIVWIPRFHVLVFRFRCGCCASRMRSCPRCSCCGAARAQMRATVHHRAWTE